MIKCRTYIGLSMQEQSAANRGTQNECLMEIEIDAVPVVSAPVEGAFSRQMMGKVDWEHVIKMKEQMKENEERRMILALRKPGIWRHRL